MFATFCGEADIRLFLFHVGIVKKLELNCNIYKRVVKSKAMHVS